MRSLLLTLWLAAVCLAQNTGTIRGTVVLRSNGQPVHATYVSLTPLGRSTETGPDGAFVFRDVPPGRYTLLAHMHALTDERKTVQVEAGQTAVVDFNLAISAVRESITVTATGQEQDLSEVFQTVTSKDSFDLAVKSSSTSLGDLLDNEAGIAKRSFGPGSTRPVIRGFDGDRVLVMQDGLSTGTLSSQSGDHGEPVDPASLERVEVVRGPATLLYGSNASGGVVNMLTNHHVLEQHPHDGLHGTITGSGGTANSQAGGSGSFEYGRGPWMIFGGGGGLRTGDYSTPLGKVPVSFSRMAQTSAGFGRFGKRVSYSLFYQLQDGRYGVPSAESEQEHQAADHQHEGDVNLKWRRHNVRWNTILRDAGPAFEQVQLAVNFSDWNHRELVNGAVGTEFFNKQFIYRTTLVQKRKGILTGSFGFSGLHRRYEAVGGEALTPPIRQNNFSLFGLEEFNFERLRLQFGGRLDSTRYGVRPGAEPRPDRSFTGASVSAGAYVPTWTGGAVVANYLHSYRAPSLEELYNLGPHPGNNAFEIGNPLLARERADSVELSVRHKAERVRAEFNLFRNHITDFVYFAPTGHLADGLIEVEYAQAPALYRGAEARLETRLHPSLWMLFGFDAVDARLTRTDSPLPRIPPVRGRVGLDWRYRSLGLRPEWLLSNKQWKTYPTETPTAGYGIGSLTASYTLARRHTVHMFHANFFNVTDKLYRNHLSLIKDAVPEIGRGVRIGYTIQWF